MEGMLAYARQSFETSRNTVVNGIARGDYNGNQYAARTTAGVPFDLGHNLKLTPIGGIELSYLEQEAYTETGAGVLNLNNSSIGATRVRSLFGPRLSYDVHTDHKYRIQPALQATWKHEFFNDGISYSSSFAGGGGAFKTPGQELTRDAFDVNASVNVTDTDNMTLSFQLGTTQSEDYSGYSGQLQAKWGF